MGTEPMYRQIADYLRARIESGEFTREGRPPGEMGRLPSEIELMERYDASRNTVRDAIKLLTTRGLVETRPGQGTFVVEKINPFVMTLTGDAETGETHVYLAEVVAGGRTPGDSKPRVEVQEASPVVADALRIKQGAQVVSRHYQRLIDGTPWSLQTSFYPMKLVEQGANRLLLATDIGEGVVSYLREALGVKQVGYRDSIAVRQPDENETAFFRLPTDGRVPVFEIFRVGFDENGGRIRLTITVMPTDRNRFLVRVGNVPARDARSDATK